MRSRRKKLRAFLERAQVGERGETNKERGRGETEETREIYHKYKEHEQDRVKVPTGGHQQNPPTTEHRIEEAN